MHAPGRRRVTLQASLFVVGVTALLSTAACASPQPTTATVALPRATSTQDAFAHLDGRPAPSSVVTLDDNATAWAARWQLVTHATRRIDLGTFIYDDDVFGRALLGALLARAQAGVHVRLLVDGRGSLALATPWFGRDDLAALVGAGHGHVGVHVFNPPWNNALLALLSLDATSVSAGSHNKLMIVDDTAIVGGRNVSVHSFATLAEDKGAVDDADVVLDGRPAVDAVSAAFVRDFVVGRRDDVGVTLLHGDGRVDELLLLSFAMDAWMHGRVAAVDVDHDDRTVADARVTQLFDLARQRLGHIVDDATSARVVDALSRLVRYRSIRGVLPLPALPRVDAPVCVVSTASRPRSADDDDATDALLRAIAGARQSIVFESPSFILGPALLLALQGASARGVDITVLTNSPRSSDSRFSQALFIDSWPELLARIPRLRIFAARVPQMQHGKRAVFDDDLSFTGTFNLDPFSTQMNSETIVAVLSPPLASSIRSALAARVRQMDEYRIARHPDGRARRHPAGSEHAGDVVVEFGPRDQVDAAEIAQIERVKAFLLGVRPLFDFDVLVW
jgi:putative cardiolipin synthase